MWQRPARVGIGVFVVAFAAVVFLGIRDRSAPSGVLAVNRADPEAVIQSTGTQVVQAQGVAESFKIVAGTQSMYADGAIRLGDGVTLTVPGQPDRTGFAVTGREADVSGDQSRFKVRGNVELTSSDGMAATTDNAAYDRGEGIVRMPGRAEFVKGDLLMLGLGATYDRRYDVVTLLSEAKVRLTLADGGAVDIRSVSATLAHEDGYMRFEGGVTFESGGQNMQAETATAYLRGQETVLQRIELHGSAQLLGSTKDAGARIMTAPDMTLTYDEAGQAVRSVVLSGGGVIELFGRDGGPGLTIAGQSLEVALGSGGSGVTNLVARDNVRVDVPRSGEARAQQISAAAFSADGEAGRGLTRARFDDAVEYRELPAQAGGAVRVAHADRLEAALDEESGQVEEARFLGGASFRDGEIRADADELGYDTHQGRVELRTMGSAGRVPRLVDRRGSIEAETIVLTLDGPNVLATGRVRSVLGAEHVSRSSQGAAATKRPALLEADQPVYVTAERLEYRGSEQVGSYQGGARLWQSATEIQAASLTLDEKAGNLAAEGKVKTRTLLRQTGASAASAIDPLTAGGGEGGRRPGEGVTTGQAELFKYEDADRRAAYQKDARVSGPQGDLTADQVILVLGSDGHQLGRIEATGDVRWRRDDRWTFGSTLNYDDADGRYEMSGSPVKIVEQTEVDCRETTGRLLTFYGSSETVAVDGRSESRTQTTRGKCPEF